MNTLVELGMRAEHLLPWLVILAGLIQLWRGLSGEPDGECGLIRRRTSALGRMKGFRLTVLGLVVVGFGVGWLLQERLFVFLALGIGIVELLESSVIIAATQGAQRREPTKQASAC